MTDRPTQEEHTLEHDPKTCHICCSPHHGDQAPDPLELENDRLRAGIEGINATLDATIAAFAREREAFRAEVERLKGEVNRRRERRDMTREFGRQRAAWGDERTTLKAELKRLRGMKAELPPFPPCGEGLPRFGLRWNGPRLPLAVPMSDGYWTPFHLAAAQVATLTARVENAEAGSVVAREYIARLVAERDASREELGRMNDGWGKHAGRAMDAAVADEREACARWVETFRAGMRFNDGKDASAAALREIAAAIRARGVKP